MTDPCTCATVANGCLVHPGGALLSCAVLGLPRPQGSMRLFRAPAGHEVAKYSDPVYEWRRMVTAAVIAATEGRTPTGEAVLLDVVFRLPRPKGHWGTGRNAGVLRGSSPFHPKTSPDLDKLLRAVSDSITDAGTVWHDDAQVVAIAAMKEYGQPGCGIHVGLLL
jgi:Holliday junction resolvase RusA-like endonuclease